MNSGDSREVPVDVLPPLPGQVYHNPTAVAEGQKPPFAGMGSFYHPASGVVILALDWLVFGTDLFTGFLALPMMCVLSFLVTFPIVYMIQTKWSGNNMRSAFGKAFLGAFMVGLPFPITGTMLGAAIIALSGLPHHPVEMLKRLTAGTSTPTK